MKEWFSDLRDRDPEFYVITVNAIATTLHAGLLGFIWLVMWLMDFPSANGFPFDIDVRFVFAATLAFALPAGSFAFYNPPTTVGMMMGATSFTMLAVPWLGVAWWAGILVWAFLAFSPLRMCASVVASVALRDEPWDQGRHRWCTALAMPVLGQILIPFEVIRRWRADPSTFGR